MVVVELGSVKNGIVGTGRPLTLRHLLGFLSLSAPDHLLDTLLIESTTISVISRFKGTELRVRFDGLQPLSKEPIKG